MGEMGEMAPGEAGDAAVVVGDFVRVGLVLIGLVWERLGEGGQG